MDLEIIWASGSPYSWSVLLTLEVKQLEYKSTLIELFKGEGRTPEFLKMNPRGKVPVLRDGDAYISEIMSVKPKLLSATDDWKETYAKTEN